MKIGRQSHGRKKGIPVRNALGDFAQIGCDLRIDLGSTVSPVVTIAIPTYRRPEKLLDAVRSALSQRFDRPFEVLIVDNDPSSEGPNRARDLVAASGPALRYFVNRENIGMFGNFNRCIEHARGEWMTILNDDDLLDADFLERMFVVLDRDPAIDGLVPQKRRVDERPDSNPWAPRRGARAAFYETFFLGRKTRPIPVNRFFWAPVLGNVVALLFKTRCGREIGGFYPEDYPSDTWFYARFAAAFRLRQHKDYGASIRVGFNESSNPATIKTFLQDGWRFREALANGDVPAWWRRLSPHLSAVHRIELEEFWNVKMPPAEVEQMLDIRLPRARPRLLKGLRVLLRGF